MSQDNKFLDKSGLIHYDKSLKSYIESEIEVKEDVSNKVTELSASSTDEQYPSAKCVYDLIQSLQSTLQTLLDRLE